MSFERIAERRRSSQQKPKRRRVSKEEVLHFFFGHLVEAIERNAELFLSTRGAIAIRVVSKGDFTIRFGDVDAPISVGLVNPVDTKVRFTPNTFVDYVEGRLDVETALHAGHLRVSGDLRLVERFGQLFTQHTGVLGLRTSSAAAGV
ncbi:MAG: SCP2 sterol-binding domain-containing protein [Myxococcota bacterium]